MPRFYFHVLDRAEHADRDGVELPGLDAARDHAVRYLAELLQSETSRFWDAGEWLLRVTDDTGLVYFTLHCGGVIAPAAAHLFTSASRPAP